MSASPFTPLPGEAFGLWRVVGLVCFPEPKRERTVPCLCACGTQRLLRVRSLCNGRTKSCGCTKNASAYRANCVRLPGDETTISTDLPKPCSHCKQGKNASAFRKDRTKFDGLDCTCKECRIAKARLVERSCDRLASYRQKAKAWVQQNRDRKRAYTAKYAKTLREARGNFTTAEWNALCASFGGMCACCGEKKRVTVDHILPLSMGGSNDIANIQPLCQSCNSAKGRRCIDYRAVKGESR